MVRTTWKNPAQLAKSEAMELAIEEPEEYLRWELRERLQGSLAEFTKHFWSVNEPSTPLQWNWHLDVLCAYVEAWFRGDLKRLIVNVPPGCMKSMIWTVMGSAWYWTRDQTARIIVITNEITLATTQASKMRKIIESPEYMDLWPRVRLSPSQAEKTLFENTSTGFFQCLGIGGNISGKRGTHLLIDDGVDAKKAFSDKVILAANQTYDQAVSSRLNVPARDRIGNIQQRLRDNDLTGHLLAKKATKWTSLVIQMRYEGSPSYDPVADLGPNHEHLVDPRTKVDEPMFPAFFTPQVLRERREDLGEYGWAGQMQQKPSPLEGGILKKKWWRVWPDDRPFPKILHTFASWDTAFTGKDFEQAAYSACTVWGVWQDERDIPAAAEQDREHPEYFGRFKLLLLSAWWNRVDFPGLLKKAKEIQARKLKKAHDAQLIEEKASGISLIQTMRRNPKLRILGYDPKIDGGGDKIARAYLVQHLFEVGIVWVPNREWAVGDDGVVSICAKFPTGAPPCLDLTDTVTQGVKYLDNGWWIHHPDDDVERESVVGVADEVDFDRSNLDNDGETEPRRWYG